MKLKFVRLSSIKRLVKFKVVGGEAPNAAQIAPKLSPLGVVINSMAWNRTQRKSVKTSRR
jgi:ribosomal protein L11